MRRLFSAMAALAALTFLFSSCEKDEQALPAEIAPQEVIDQLLAMGFNPDGIEVVEEGYRIERDIIITQDFLDHANHAPQAGKGGIEKQYSTNNLVSTNGNRTITMYAAQGGRTGYSAAMIAGLDEAISRYNAMNLSISFQRSNSSQGADIVMSRLSKRDESRGVLGSAGFPTSTGDPYGQIKMSGVLESSYGLSTNGIATIIAHEMGHCIGLRHTDYFDRSISCGGSTSNEGASSVGANHIPGTPTGASLSQQSFMLSCTDGSNRNFNNDDKTALNYLY